MKELNRKAGGVQAGFSLIEMLVVITIILIIGGLVVGGASSLRASAARAQTTTEIGAILQGLERFRTDNGDYPEDLTLDPGGTNTSDRYPVRPDLNYVDPGKALFLALTGRPTYGTPVPYAVNYIGNFKESQVATDSDNLSYFSDPWQYAYGYFYSKDGIGGDDAFRSLYGQAVPDVWSTGGKIYEGASSRARWVSSWETN